MGKGERNEQIINIKFQLSEMNNFLRSALQVVPIVSNSGLDI